MVVEVALGEKQLWHEAEETLRAAMSDRPFEIAENATVPPAEFMLSSAVGTVDARLQPQLEVCRTHLLGRMFNVVLTPNLRPYWSNCKP